MHNCTLNLYNKQYESNDDGGGGGRDNMVVVMNQDIKYVTWQS